MTAHDTPKWNHAPREKLNSRPNSRMPMIIRSIRPDAAHQNPIEHDQRRPDQEGAEHVGILEGAERTAERSEQFMGVRERL